MNHQSYADAAIDPGAPQPPDLEQHLRSCPDCAALAAGHRAALKLEGALLPRVRPAPRSAVGLRLALVAATVLVVAAGARALLPGSKAPGARTPEPEVVRAVEPGRGAVEGAVLVAEVAQAADAEAEWLALSALHQQVSGYTRVDASAQASALAASSTLPQWFALETLGARVDSLSQSSPAVEVEKESP